MNERPHKNIYEHFISCEAAISDIQSAPYTSVICRHIPSTSHSLMAILLPTSMTKMLHHFQCILTKNEGDDEQAKANISRAVAEKVCNSCGGLSKESVWRMVPQIKRGWTGHIHCRWLVPCYKRPFFTKWYYHGDVTGAIQNGRWGVICTKI